MKSLARMLQDKKEREERKAERERIKKEKLKEKEKEKRKERAKRLKKKRSQAYYKEFKKQRDAERAKEGEEVGGFIILTTKNKKKVETLATSRFKTVAYKKYTELVEKNHKEIGFPLQVTKLGNNDEFRDAEFEILLIKKVKEGEDNVAKFKNEDGKYVDNILIGKTTHKIIAKDEWYIEDSFNVYGYHPTKDRKDFHFIMKELVLKDLYGKEDTRSITTFKDKLFINYFDDFEFVICKSVSECQRLYATLEKKIPKEYKKFVLFFGEVGKQGVPNLLDRMQAKTGWTRYLCAKINQREK